MRLHASYMWICGAVIVAALVIALITGSGGFLVPALGCVAMMVVMMALMGGHGGHRG